MANLTQLKRTSKRPYRRVGRGQSSTRGKTSGRGTKGQSARAGRKKRPEWRDIIKKLPKRRGFGKNRGRTVVRRDPVFALSLARLEKEFDSGAEVTRQALFDRGIAKVRAYSSVKIVGGGDLSKKFVIKGVPISASAKKAVEAAGGSIS